MGAVHRRGRNAHFAQMVSSSKLTDGNCGGNVHVELTQNIKRVPPASGRVPKGQEGRTILQVVHVVNGKYVTQGMGDQETGIGK